jgi:hypothetical protein
MIYHVARNNQQLGTFPKEEILARYNSGAILPTDLVWTDGMATWEPASKIFGAPAAPDGGGIDAPATPPPYAPPPPVTGVATPMTTTPPAVAPPKPNNNLVGAILVTLFCCWPLGIPSIVFAAQVDGKYASGNYAGAEESAKKSRLFMWWALGIGIGAIIITVFSFGLIGAFANQYGY